MERILVSACLLDQPVRYDGRAKTCDHPALARWQAEGRLIPFCPEMAAGFPVPRPAAELLSNDAGSPSECAARVIDARGADVTDAFRAGAEAAVDAACRAGVCYAVLTDGSPSCGSSFVYDGSFTGARRPGAGITATLLRSAGVQVFSPDGIDELAALIETTGHHLPPSN